MKIAYIYYVFDTITEYQLDKSLESISLMDAVSGDFILFNASSNYDDNFLLKKMKDHSIKLPVPFNAWHWEKNKSVVADIRDQINIITGYDQYFCHKADFYLGRRTYMNTLRYLNTPRPTFINLSKFDLRENYRHSLDHVSYFSWEETICKKEAYDMTNHDHSGLTIEHTMIGYRGWDGTMHAYNERARELLEVDTYWEADSVQRNMNKGINMIYGMNDTVAFHMFHPLPGGRQSDYKNIEGYRF